MWNRLPFQSLSAHPHRPRDFVSTRHLRLQITVIYRDSHSKSLSYRKPIRLIGIIHHPPIPTVNRHFKSFLEILSMFIGIVLDLWNICSLDLQHYNEYNSESEAAFLAHMSHEIRTPLNGLISMLDFIMETNLTSEQRYSLTRNSSVQLKLLIECDQWHIAHKSNRK